MKHLTRQLCAALITGLGGGRPNVPEAGVPLWNAFSALSRARTYHAAGPHPLSFSEIEAWSRLMRVPLEPQHVQVITAMDEVWMDCASAKAQGREGVKILPPKSSKGLNPGLFDAMMGPDPGPPSRRKAQAAS
ncbi:hypothetical protein FAZ78_00325 [Cereibacter changlensis]|uniref:Uncharacterized protein n=1 Tax=Cereibacter changlensis TaxID=402884 RepID=A0A4U0Z2P7_9RHOB|nr:hypothetical protein [Cereibacter changlensis]TKA98538.1 hypothetical protein FAZ78_00325 [Cereibacter changlensis]